MLLSRRNSALPLLCAGWLAAISADAAVPLSAVTLVPQNGHSGAVTNIRIEPKSGQSITSGEDGTVRIWHLADGLILRVIYAHAGAIRALALEPRGQFIATAGVDRRVCVWDIAGGNKVWEKKEDGIGTISLAWSRDGGVLAASADRVVMLRRDGSESGAIVPDSPPSALAWTLDGRAGDRGPQWCGAVVETRRSPAGTGLGRLTR